MALGSEILDPQTPESFFLPLKNRTFLNFLGNMGLSSPILGVLRGTFFAFDPKNR